MIYDIRGGSMQATLLAVAAIFAATLSGCAQQWIVEGTQPDDADKPADIALVDRLQIQSPSHCIVPIAYTGKPLRPSRDVVVVGETTPIDYPPIPFLDQENAEPREQPARTRAKIKDGLWQNIRERLILADLQHPRIDDQVEFLKGRRGFVRRLTRRAKPYLHLIVEEISYRGLPMDLALVPMVESGFQTNAVSSQKAAGIWQIIPTTGTAHGLVLAEGYDGRYDIQTSTRAALTYLQNLNKRFKGDWLLALAAYNAGEGRVERAIAKNKNADLETSYWDLDLPEETKKYVPRIVALSRMIAYPKDYGLKFKKIGNQPFLFRVQLAAGADLAEVVEIAEIPAEDFYRFNPGFTPEVAPPKQAYKVLLPEKHAVVLSQHLPGARLLAPQLYKVKKGDTLSVIAKRYGTNYKKLVAWNGLTNINVIRPGQKLIVRPTPRT